MSIKTSTAITITTVAVIAGSSFLAWIFYKKFACSTTCSPDLKTPVSKKKTKKGPITLEDPKKKYSLKLIKKIEVSPDTREFIFALPSKRHILGLPVGQHLYMFAKINNKNVVRLYTPISSDDDHGIMKLLIKVYFANSHPNFPNGGKMSQYLESLHIGDHLEFRGPSGLITYEGNGVFVLEKNKAIPPARRQFKNVGMIAGGTGITPMFQIISEVLKHEDDPTKLSLLFANQTENDILLKAELDELADKYPDRFNLWYTVDRPSPLWEYSVGFINDEMIEKHLPKPSDDTAIFMCGPPPMIKFACHPNLEKLGYSSENSFAF